MWVFLYRSKDEDEPFSERLIPFKMFELVPTLDRMMEIYRLPSGNIRFEKYLSSIKGSSDNDMEIPLAGYNPMAKDHVLLKMEELQKLNAERVMEDLFSDPQLTECLPDQSKPVKVALNLSDDLKGGWTNRFTSDYDSKFKTNAYLRRKFCVPIFWTSENYSESLIQKRTLEYLYRYIYQQTHRLPAKLKEHLEQEIFVASHFKYPAIPPEWDLPHMMTFYEKFKDTEDYATIFNFFYGDKACETLSFPTFHIKTEMAGFLFAQISSFKHLS